MLKHTTILALATLFFLSGCNSENKETKKPEIQTKIVKVLQLENKNSLDNWHEYPAQIFPYHNVNMAFELSGKIVEFNCKAGQRVTKGTLLAKLDDTIYKSNLQATHANYQKALTDYKRYEKLYTQNVIAKDEFERASQNLAVQKANYDIANKNLDNTKLIAEFDGIIAKKNVDDFARVTAKQSILILQDNSKYKVKFNIPESDILKSEKRKDLSDVAKNVDIIVTLGEDNSQEYKATLADISTLAQSVTRTYEITALIDNPKDKNVLPGMTAKVKTKLNSTHNTSEIFIPYKALFSDTSKGSFVWSVNDANKIHKKEVQTGRLESDLVQIVSGLHGDERIVTSGVHQLQVGDTIAVYKKIGN